MLLPFIAWVVTGIFFFYKPGYKAAYQALPVKHYPIESLVELPSSKAWLEVRQLKTILGHHLLVKDSQGWKQLSPIDFTEVNTPSKAQVTLLLEDAITADTARYGEIQSIDALNITTNTKVRISLNWQKMTLYQQGADTDFINLLYDIHYLRWTGNKTLDQYLGVIGLLLVLLLAVIGTWMTINRKNNK